MKRLIVLVLVFISTLCVGCKDYPKPQTTEATIETTIYDSGYRHSYTCFCESDFNYLKELVKNDPYTELLPETGEIIPGKVWKVYFKFIVDPKDEIV